MNAFQVLMKNVVYQLIFNIYTKIKTCHDFYFIKNNIKIINVTINAVENQFKKNIGNICRRLNNYKTNMNDKKKSVDILSRYCDVLDFRFNGAATIQKKRTPTAKWDAIV